MEAAGNAEQEEYDDDDDEYEALCSILVFVMKGRVLCVQYADVSSNTKGLYSANRKFTFN